MIVAYIISLFRVIVWQGKYMLSWNIIFIEYQKKYIWIGVRAYHAVIL